MNNHQSDLRAERLAAQAFALANQGFPLYYGNLWRGILMMFSGRRTAEEHLPTLLSLAEDDIGAVRRAARLIAAQHKGSAGDRAISLLAEVELEIQLNSSR